MSHCLTQPEGIDHILMAMAGGDMEVDTPIPGGVRPSGTARNVGRDDFAKTANFPYDAVHKKSAHSLSDL